MVAGITVLEIVAKPMHLSCSLNYEIIIGQAKLRNAFIMWICTKADEFKTEVHCGK